MVPLSSFTAPLFLLVLVFVLCVSWVVSFLHVAVFGTLVMID